MLLVNTLLWQCHSIKPGYQAKLKLSQINLYILNEHKHILRKMKYNTDQMLDSFLFLRSVFCCFVHVCFLTSHIVLLDKSLSFVGGWCEKYLVLGDHCSPFARLNGHCSCGPNLTCKRFPYTTPSSSIVKRKLLPGYYRCDTV